MLCGETMLLAVNRLCEMVLVFSPLPNVLSSLARSDCKVLSDFQVVGTLMLISFSGSANDIRGAINKEQNARGEM